MRTTKVKVSVLLQHPFHKKTYSLKYIDDLAESMKRTGLLNPVIINGKKQVLSGWRRVLAAKQLKWKEIEVVYHTNLSPSNEARLIIDFNRQRIKTILDKWKEIQELKKYWGKKQGERTDRNPKLSTEEKKHTKDRIASAMGISTGNVYKIEKIAATDKFLFSLIDSGEISIHEAYNRCSGDATGAIETASPQSSEPGSGTVSHSNSAPKPLAKLYAHTCPHCGKKFND